MWSKSIIVFTISVVVSVVGMAQLPPGLSPAKAYQLGPGDEVTGKVLGENQFDFVATVNEDGFIQVPFSQRPVAALCRTEKDLRADLTSLLSEQLKSPQFSLNTKRNSRPPTTVYGEVRKPENYMLMRKATLLELIAMSGGPTEEAGGIVEVTRTQPPLCADDMDKNDWAASMNGNASVPMKMYNLSGLRAGKDDPVIYPGDIVRVLRAPPVYVVGEVVAPQGMYLRDGGMTLLEAVNKLGGVRREAKTKDVKIYRLKDANSKDREILTANLDMIKSGQQRDIALQANDIVEVNKAKESIAQTILQFAIGAGKTAITSGVSSIGYRVVY
jgi:polysaccharide export outer membrane protein